MHTPLKFEHKLVVNIKKDVNKQFRKYHSDLVKKIRVLKGSDPKTYWKIINGTILKNKTRQNAFLPRYF